MVQMIESRRRQRLQKHNKNISKIFYFFSLNISISIRQRHYSEKKEVYTKNASGTDNRGEGEKKIV